MDLPRQLYEHPTEFFLICTVYLSHAMRQEGKLNMQDGYASDSPRRRWQQLA